MYQFKCGIFKGYGIGWQGIIPMIAAGNKTANIAVDLIAPDMITIEDIVARVDPQVLANMLKPACLNGNVTSTNGI